MIKLISHRGKWNNIIKENTYLSIKNALFDDKYFGVEFDVHLTKDKKLVVIHDDVINFVSDGNGRVKDMTLNELYKYNFGSKRFRQSIPTLKRILDIDSDKLFVIELKCDNNEKEMAFFIMDILKNYNDKNIYICSFNKKVLKLLKNRVNFKLGRIYLSSFFIKNYDFISLPKYVNVNKYLKKEVFIWTLNSKDDISKFENINNLFVIYEENE